MCRVAHRHHHVIVLAHGSHGTWRDLSYIAWRLATRFGYRGCQDSKISSDHHSLEFAQFVKALQLSGEASSHPSAYVHRCVKTRDSLTSFSTTPRRGDGGSEGSSLWMVLVNIGHTDRGIDACTHDLCNSVTRTVQSLVEGNHRQPDHVAIRADTEGASSSSALPQSIVLHGIGHSLGGVLLRRGMPSVVSELKKRNAKMQVRGGQLVTIASPHAGVTDMPSRGLRLAGRCVAAAGRSVTYNDLFLKNGTLLQPFTNGSASDLPPGGSQWWPFRKVLLVGERNDRLVSVTSSTLLGGNSSCVLKARATSSSMDGVGVIDMAHSVYSPLPLPRVDPQSAVIIDTEASRLTTPRERHQRLLLHLRGNRGDVDARPDDTGVVNVEHALLDLNSAARTTTSYRYRWSRIAVNPALVFARTHASHRAVVCKAPFCWPEHFGCYADWIADKWIQGHSDDNSWLQ